MAKPLVSDALWQRLEPLLPPPPPRRFRFPGRGPLDYRKILTGIVFLLKTGLNWEDLPAELGWVAARPARAISKPGKRQGSGTSFTRFSWKNFKRRTRSIGLMGQRTAPRAGLWAVVTTPALTPQTEASYGQSTTC